MPMISFRTLLLWLVLFAVPFQGYAAATMAFCVSDLPQSVATESAQVGPSHGTAHDHVQHQHSAVNVDNAHDHQDHVSSDNDGVHKCGMCGACHAVALLSSPKAIEVVVLPPAELTEPFSAVAILAPGVLDKPPRA